MKTKQIPLLLKLPAIETMTIRKTVWWIITFGVPFVLCSVLAYSMREYTADDALIYYRYIQNCLDGHGLVYNIGERFNGLTSPFYTYLSLLVAFVFGGNIHYTQIAMGALFLFLTCITATWVLKEIIPKTFILFLPLLLTSSAFFYKTFGLETTLFLFLVLTSLYLYQRQSYGILGVVGALLLLTRGESIFLVIILLFFYWKQHQHLPPIKVFILPALILILHLSLTYAYYGELLPNTLAAKIYQGASGLWGRFAFAHHLPSFSKWFWNDHIFLPMFITIIAIIGIRAAWKHHILRLMLIFLGSYCSFYVIFNIPDYFWYYGYVFLMLYILFVFGMHTLYTSLSYIRLKAIHHYRYVVILSLFLFVFGDQLYVSAKLLQGLQGQTHYKTIGTWIREHTESDAKIACIEIGHIGWYSKRYIIDILGLVNPYNAKYLGQKKFDKWLSHYSPDYILVWVPLRPHEISVQKLLEEKRYVLFHEFDFNGWKFRLLRKAT